MHPFIGVKSNEESEGSADIVFLLKSKRDVSHSDPQPNAFIKKNMKSMVTSFSLL